MKKMLINATQQEELRVALVDGQQLYDLDIETLHAGQKKSNIYKGKITRIEPSLEAVFVDYGGKRHGFLPFKEIAKQYLGGSTSTHKEKPTLKDMLTVGQKMLVQIEKEERGNKGAALSTYIGLAGRFLVLMPNNPRAGGVSRRIQGDERRELRDTLDALEMPADMGIIIRTAGVGRSREELQWDLDFLLQVWEAISEAYQQCEPCRLIYQESNIIVRALRDYLRPDIGQILIDDERLFNQAMEFMNLVMPKNVNKLKLYQDTLPLFTRYQIEGQIETAYQRNVQLPSGGELVIDYTEALVSIDINSSKATKGEDIEETAYRANLEAADEIARQLRLRDIGGLIVIDFIDMTVSRHRKAVEQRFAEATTIDRARIQSARISHFGMMELSRQRLRPSIDEASHQVCPRCKGQGSIRGIQSQALSLLRLIEEEAMKERSKRITGELPVALASFLLNEKRAALRAIEQRNEVEIVLMANPNLQTPDYHIERLRDDEVSDAIAKTPSYRLPIRQESEKGNGASDKPPAPAEKPLVSGIVPQQPIPQRKEMTEAAPETAPAPGGLSAVFAKVVALFTPGARPQTPAAEEKGQSEQEEKAKNTRRPTQRRRAPRETDGRGKTDTPQPGAAGKTRAGSENSRNTNRRTSRRTPRKNAQTADPRQAQQENQEKSRGAGAKPAVTDDVNPSVEALSHPPKTRNGREVRKGRPRDVHAVRGQGKAPKTGSPRQSQETPVPKTRAATKTGNHSDLTKAQPPAEKTRDKPVPPARNEQAPGLVSLLENPEGTRQADEPAAAPATAIVTRQSYVVSKEQAPNHTNRAGGRIGHDDSAEITVAQESETRGQDTAETPTEQALEALPLIRRLPALGQSLWYDALDRAMLDNATLRRLIKEDDLRGVTSNLETFQSAFTASNTYDDALKTWLAQGSGEARDAFYALAVADIQTACDQMQPVYEKTNGSDGMVSLAVSADPADDARAIIAQARALHERVARENLMIEVAATAVGCEALHALTAAGVNVNATLLFSVAQYQRALEAYIAGLEARVRAGKSIDLVCSVASFSVSHVDSAVDRVLGEKHPDLRGRTAIANAQVAYAYFLERISHDDWIALQRKGAAVQRLLWTSTATIDPRYNDTRYVDMLIGADTINAVSPQTYAAFKDQGTAEATLMRAIEQAPLLLDRVREAGVDLDALTAKLQKDGIARFQEAFRDLLAALDGKIERLKHARNRVEEDR